MRLLRCVGVVMGLLALASARASDISPAPPPLPGLEEIRLGVVAHDPWSPERGAADITGEILLAPFAVGGWTPRLALGGTASTAGKTSFGHTTALWRHDMTETLFIEAGLGLALHNGLGGTTVPANRNRMDCALHFRETLGLGYRIDAHWAVIGFVEHISNAGLCRENRGLTHAGVKLGYRF